MRTKLPYEFYLEGYWNGVHFGCMPDMLDINDILAYSMGYKQGKINLGFQSINQFEINFNNLKVK